jgi:hypothetical protein
MKRTATARSRVIWAEARGERCIDAVEHALQSRAARDRLEAVFAQRVERNICARETCRN